MVAGTLGFFLWEQSRGASIEAARTAASNALAVCEIFYLFNCRFLLDSSCSMKAFTQSRPVLASIFAAIVLQLLFTYAPPFQKLFGTAALDAAAWWRITLFGVLLFCVVELEKMWFRRRGERPS